MILLVLLVLALFVTQTLLPGFFRESVVPGESGKMAEYDRNHDNKRPLTVRGQRATRALANMHEALPVFLALALMNMIAGSAASLACTGAIVFLIARVIYVPLYINGIPALRSTAWGISWIGLILMLIPLIERAL